MSTNKIEIQISATDQASKVVEGVGESLEEAGAAAQGAGKDLQDASTSAQGAGKGFKDAGTQAQGVGESLEEAGAAAQGAGKDLQNAGTSAQGAGKGFKDAGTQAQGVGESLEEAGAAAQGAGKDLQDAGTSAQGAGKGFKDAGTQAQGVGKGLRDVGAASTSLDSVRQRGLKAADGIKSISEQLALVQKAVVLFQGGNVLTGLIKDISATADEYADLAGRIKLATGEGELFASSFERVQQIALDTYSSLEGTGDLFARLTEAGKSAGLSTKMAAEQALDLTESINQAVQVSGAGAEASDAALRQLIQGLQGGALRGDEFNSVMEQSPRLAKAMADGLGVTTGQLREMANEGRLTSAVVIESLKSQANVLKAEFDTLPPTVGRAVQNLSTAWTVYIGETDKATGASKTAAQAINVLADNLDIVAGYLIDAGQAAAAFAALRLAQTFLGIGAAARTSATAIAANTAALNAANAASAGATAGIGRFGAMLGGLKTFALLAILTNIQDIGTWIGESVAQLAGYKDLSEELANTERSRAEAAKEGVRIAQAQAAANKEARESQFELNRVSRETIAAFDALRASGKSAGDAIREVGKDFDLQTQPGIANAAAALDKLASDGKLAAEELRQAWSDALKGEDLQAFEVNARTAFAGSAREAERLAQVMDATLREAVRRSGEDFDVLAGGMSKAARSAINDTDTIIAGLDRLKAQGIDTGRALESSLVRAIKTADSQAALDALKGRIDAVRGALGDQVADGLLRQIEDQATRAASALGTLNGALAKLGITSDAELKRAAEETRSLYEEVVKAGGSAREQAAAFEKMARSAIESGDAGALAFARAQAASKGFEIATDAAGKTTVRSMDEAAKATRGAGDAADRAAGGYSNMAQSAEQAAASAAKLAEINARYSSPLGADKYSRPNGGTVAGAPREERLAGQGASDETLRFELLKKLQTGSLTEADLPALKAVVSTLRSNQQMFDSLPPGMSSLDALRDDQKWKAATSGFEQAISRFSGGSGAAGASGVGRTSIVKLDGGKGQRGSFKFSSDEDADQAIKAIEMARARS